MVLLLGACLILFYVVSVLRQPLRGRTAPEDWEIPANWTTELVFNLGLLGLYGLFAYFWVVEKLSDAGFRALVRMFDGGV